MTLKKTTDKGSKYKNQTITKSQLHIIRNNMTAHFSGQSPECSNCSLIGLEKLSLNARVLVRYGKY